MATSRTAADKANDKSTGQQSDKAETASYTVNQVAINHDGKLYQVGETIDLTADQAERLGGLVAPANAAALT